MLLFVFIVKLRVQLTGGSDLCLHCVYLLSKELIKRPLELELHPELALTFL
jgi:hypothetical protein